LDEAAYRGTRIRKWKRLQQPVGKLAFLTAGPSANHPEANHRIELIEI
jgi:hypothetical protein